MTVTAGVPTIWMGILQTLDANPGAYDLSQHPLHDRRRRSAAAGDDRGVRGAPRPAHHARLGHDRDVPGRDDLRRSGPGDAASRRRTPTRVAPCRALPIPFVEIRASGDEGFVPWDGATMGELEVRGPSIASAYYESDEGADRWTDDGWFKTGDIVTIHPDGFVEMQDRAKDLVKSGGEWISTVALENALMGHPAVAEAAVIAVPDEKWSERPLAVVVLARGRGRRRPTSCASSSRRASRSGGCPTGSSSSTRSRRPRSASSARPRFASEFSAQPRGDDLVGDFITTEHDGSVARRHDRQPADERALGAAPRRARSRDRPPRRRRRRPRDRARRRGRARLRRRCGHQGVPVAARGRRGCERARLGPRDPEARPPDGRGTHAVRRGDPRASASAAGSSSRCAATSASCSDDAQLGQPEIKLGLIPGGGGTQRLPRLVGIGRAQYLNMTGDFIDAATAYDWGLVEKVVPREELRETALGIARTIAARSPVSIAVLRELARTTRDLSARGGPAPRGGRLPPLPRVARTARRASPRSSRSASLSSPAVESRRLARGRRARAARRPGGARARGRRGPGRRRRARGGHQLRGRPDPPRDVPADAGAPGGARLRDRGRARRRARHGLRSRRGRRLRRARRWSTRAGSSRCPASASFAEGAAFPMAFLTVVDPADRARADRVRRARADHRRRRCRRHRGRPGRPRAERQTGRGGRAARRSSSCRARSARSRP